MDLHHHSQHSITQLETLLRQTELMLRALELRHQGLTDAEERNGCDSSLQHLRNTIRMLSDVALGYAWTVDGTLTEIGRMADEGSLPAMALDELLAPACEHLGEAYVDAAMAADQGD